MTCAGLQLSCLTSYRRAEKPKMVSTPTPGPIYGLRPQIRGWSAISTEPGFYLHLCKGWSMYLKGAGGGLAQVALMGGGGEAHTTGFLVTCLWGKGHKVCMHYQHDQDRPWNLCHVVSGPWTSFVAVLDKGQWNIAICRRHSTYYYLFRGLELGSGIQERFYPDLGYWIPDPGSPKINFNIYKYIEVEQVLQNFVEKKICSKLVKKITSYMILKLIDKCCNAWEKASWTSAFLPAVN